MVVPFKNYCFEKEKKKFESFIIMLRLPVALRSTIKNEFKELEYRKTAFTIHLRDAQNK